MVKTNKQKTKDDQTLPIHLSSAGSAIKDDKDIWNNTRPITVKGKCSERNDHIFFIPLTLHPFVFPSSTMRIGFWIMIFDGIETRFTKESPTRILILTLRLVMPPMNEKESLNVR